MLFIDQLVRSNMFLWKILRFPENNEDTIWGYVYTDPAPINRSLSNETSSMLDNKPQNACCSYQAGGKQTYKTDEHVSRETKLV